MPARRCTRVVAGALIALAPSGRAAIADFGTSAFGEERDGFEDPPLALPQQINGIIRASAAAGTIRPIERITHVFAALRACWEIPDGALATGQQVTIRVSFRRTGEMIGRPTITYSRPTDDRDERDRFARSAVDAFERCTPLPFSPSFGAAIAGRPFTFRFVDDRPT
jgi:hypothetical protein